MRKITLLFVFITSLCFTQTGIITRGPAMGLWFLVERQIECDNCNPVIELSYDIMTRAGFEIGLGIGKSDEVDIKSGHLTYHINRGNTNFSISKGTRKNSEEYTFNGVNMKSEVQTDSFEIGIYDNSGLVFSVMHFDNNIGDEGEILSIGKFFSINERTYAGLTYSVDYDVFDAMLEDLEIELLKYGSISITYGGIF